MDTQASQMSSFDFPNRLKVLELIREAMSRAGSLGSSYEAILIPAFAAALSLLSTTANEKKQLILLLSAVHQNISLAEKNTISTMLHDDTISINQMSDLVQVRLICARAKVILAESLAELKGFISSPGFSLGYHSLG